MSKTYGTRDYLEVTECYEDPRVVVTIGHEGYDDEAQTISLPTDRASTVAGQILGAAIRVTDDSDNPVVGLSIMALREDGTLDDLGFVTCE